MTRRTPMTDLTALTAEAVKLVRLVVLGLALVAVAGAAAACRDRAGEGGVVTAEAPADPVEAAAPAAPPGTGAAPAGEAEPAGEPVAEGEDPLASYALSLAEPAAGTIDASAALTGDPALASPWRAVLAHTAVSVSWDAAGLEVAASGSGEAPSGRVAPSDARGEVVVLEGGSRPRIVSEAYGLRSLLYVPASALLLVPDEVVVVQSSPDAAPSLEPGAPGVALAPGALTALRSSSDDGLFVEVLYEEPTLGLATRGWLPLPALGRVYRPEPFEPTSPETSPLTSAATLRAAPGQGELVSLPVGTAVEVLARDAANGYVLARVTTPTLAADGWLPTAALQPLPEDDGMGVGPLGLSGIGTEGWGTSGSPTWVTLPAGTRLHSAPQGPEVAVVLDAERALVREGERDGWTELTAMTRFGTVQLWAPTGSVTPRE